MTLQPGKQKIAKHILPNISRSKGNHTMKFFQLIEHNMINTFLNNHTQNVVRKPLLNLFKKSKLSISLDQCCKVLKQFVFIVCQVEGYRFILKLSCKPLAFPSYKAFLKKQKEVWNQSPYHIFCLIFKEKYFLQYIPLSDQILFSGFLYFVRYWPL